MSDNTTAAAKADLLMRLEMLQRAMGQRGIGGLVVYYGGQHNMLREDQLFWLTDYRSLGPAIALVPVRGEVQLIVAPPWDLGRAKEAAGVTNVVGVAPRDLIKTAGERIRSLRTPLALSGRAVMPIAAYEELLPLLGGPPGDGEDLIPSVSTIRTPLELERVTRAAAIADDGFRALCEAVKPGMREYELAAEVEAVMHAAGAEDNFGLIASGAQNVAIRPPTDRKIEKGDVVIAEITPCYNGYLAQLCRTYIVGEPTEKQRNAYKMLMAAERMALFAATPGKPSGGIARAINNVISAAGFAEYCKPPYMRTRGHGLGTGGVVPADINEDTGVVLERGMTMVIHPNQFIPETGYLMCGDTFVIEDKPRRLTQTAIQLFGVGVEVASPA